MTTFNVPDGPKMLRETLCVAQARIANSPYDEGRKREHIDRLGRLIDECDRHRPIGPNGKHGNRHTRTCGCDKPTLGQRLRAWWSAKQDDTGQRMATRPHATGPPSENPYCMRCSKHLGIPFHETNEHDEAANLGPALANRAQGAPTEAAHAGRSPESAYHRGSESGRPRGRLRAWWQGRRQS